MQNTNSINSLTWDKAVRKGDIGESFLRWFCLESNLAYKNATKEQNMLEGVDCFIEGIPTDVKNTSKLFLGNFRRDSNTFYSRHPFRHTTTCVNYCILDINTTQSSFKIKYSGPIKDYLLNRYFRDEVGLTETINILEKYNQRTLQGLKLLNSESLLIQIKKEIKPFLQKEIYCNYDSVSESIRMNSNDQAISLIAYEDRT